MPVNFPWFLPLMWTYQTVVCEATTRTFGLLSVKHGLVKICLNSYIYVPTPRKNEERKLVRRRAVVFILGLIASRASGG